ncbi:hypothetical protein M378DRAFT_90762 [Amanita muscaria Koide BX008]|uniref:CxC6 like cysteine cluster associated with KDZ domain-containing protein n=1 Tax=Amanita muscaria (strain Koide BX008) TaxID=946122 RepID=A0A0C2RYX2_AMAMK|nr:hypothetical protein M378DRAFT_90762 [Amanita muscaria Koide BX008]
MYVHEDGEWSIKGRFKHAIEANVGVTWETENGQLTLSLCAEGNNIFGASYAPVVASYAPVAGTSDGVPVSKVVGTGDISKKELIALLNIPEQLTVATKNADVRLSYAKYKACLNAQETLGLKIKDGTWPSSVKKPTITQIIEIFVSKTSWHKYMTKAFHDISHHAGLKAWLEDEAGGPTDIVVWGKNQATYTISDLMKEKERLLECQQASKGKGKGKAAKKNQESGVKNFHVLYQLKYDSVCLFKVFEVVFRVWTWMMIITNVPLVAAASKDHQHFPSIPFSVFNKFVEDNFVSTVSLSTVLMVLFTVTENTDLLSFRQRSAEHDSEKSTAATGWIRNLGAAVKRRLDKDQASLLGENEMDEDSSEQKVFIAMGMKLDALARVLGLCPINKAGKFKRKLKPVSNQQVQPVHTICPNIATCQTMTCNKSVIYQGTRPRDVPLVRFIKDFTVYDEVPVYSGRCKHGEHERVYVNSAKYIKIGQQLWVDRSFTSAVLSGMYTFHASAAAYTEFWNNSFDRDGRGELGRRQVWQAFVQESIRLVASASDTQLTIMDGLSIDEVTKEASNVLGANGVIRCAQEHSCPECTQEYKRPTVEQPADEGGVEAEPVKMVVLDGIVMGHTHCAFEGCTGQLANARGGVYCALHELRHGGTCHVAECQNPIVQNTLACEEHQEKWRRFLMNHRQKVLDGYKRVLRRPDETWPWMPEAPQVQPHDEEQQVVRGRSRDHFIPPRMYCVETICAPCGVVVAWAKFDKAESPKNIMDFLQLVYPEQDKRPAYICIDKACLVLKSVINNTDWLHWLDTSRFIVDAYHYINHRATDEVCRTWCNPAPLNGSAPNLVIPERDAQGQLYHRRAFNTQVCEQLNAWLGGFETILKRMSPGNFDWFLHAMLFYHTMQVLT